MKTNPKKRLRIQADSLWYKKCLQEWCEVCENGRAVQVHHYFFKSQYGHLRYDLDNGISLCQGCHFCLHFKDPHIIEDKIREKRGEKWYLTLKKKALDKPKSSYQTVKWYKDNISKLRKKK
jgi:hypothetical protein